MNMEDNQSRNHAYVQAIKERLNARINGCGIKNNTLATLISKKYHIQIYPKTIKNTLDDKKDTIDLMCVVGLCRYFNMDLNYVFSKPDTPDPSLIEEDSEVEVLTDPLYLGKTYGYMYSPKNALTDVDEFDLDIRKENETTKAYLTLHSHSTDDDGEPYITHKTLEGIPKVIKSSNICIIFEEPNVQTIVMMFSYVSYNYKKIYFRRGAFIGQGRDANRQPLLESFVLFNKKLKPTNANDEYKKGFLLLYDRRTLCS